MLRMYSCKSVPFGAEVEDAKWGYSLEPYRRREQQRTYFMQSMLRDN
jgi:hypothetical protein